MSGIIRTTILGLFFGTFGTTIGGIIGIWLDTSSNKFLSFILNFAAGLMISIVCFELIPEALEIASLISVMIGMAIGIIIMIWCERKVSRKNTITKHNNSLLKTGIIIGIGLAIHNFPEGLAIGSGFSSSMKLGISLALAIAIHDIPEGISMSVPLKTGGMKPKLVLIYTILSGVTTGVGAFFGKLIGGISEELVSICLSIAAGAMLYISSRRVNSRI